MAYKCAVDADLALWISHSPPRCTRIMANELGLVPLSRHCERFRDDGTKF